MDYGKPIREGEKEAETIIYHRKRLLNVSKCLGNVSI